MTMIDWSILKPVDVAGAAMEGFNRGRAQSAMGALARDPTNRDALAALYQVDPASAARMETVGRERATWQQQQDARNAQRAYITARYGGGPPAPNALSSGPSLLTGAGGLPSVGGVAPPTTLPSQDALAPPPPISGEGFGAPSLPPTRPARVSGADQTWLAYAQVDPAGAMQARTEEAQWQSTRLKLSQEDLKAHQAVNSVAMSLLNGVHDQASYDAARTAAAHVYEQYGYEMPELPPTYSAELVHHLQLRGMEVKDAIAADLAERRFGWQQRDDQIDNARDDRRVAIQDRGQRDESARGWSRDRRDERRFQRGDQVTIDDPTGRLIGALRND